MTSPERDTSSVFGEVPDRRRDPRPGDDVAEIRVVCTGNIARSPLCMAMLEAEARRRLGPDAPVWVESSGVHGVVGEPAVSHSRDLATERGLDLSRHRGAVTTREDVLRSDLVLTMTEQQRNLVVRRAPQAARWTFTLREFARLLAAADRPPDDLPVRERIRWCVRQADAARPYVERPRDREDVADPYGHRAEVYRTMAADLDELVEVVAPRLFGSLPDGAPTDAYGAVADEQE